MNYSTTVAVFLLGLGIAFVGIVFPEHANVGTYGWALVLLGFIMYFVQRKRLVLIEPGTSRFAIFGNILLSVIWILFVWNCAQTMSPPNNWITRLMAQLVGVGIYLLLSGFAVSETATKGDEKP